MMKNEIVLFTDGDINIEVQINPEQETVWLTLFILNTIKLLETKTGKKY